MNTTSTLTLPVVALALVSLFTTGCSQVAGSSQTQQVAGSTQQQATEAPKAAVEHVAPEPAAEPAEPKHTGNKWTHTHPAIPACTDSISHTHKYNSKNHNHKYGCTKGANTGSGSVNVHALQRKLKAKGYYKGPINGVVTPQTRSALQRYMQNR